MRLSETQKGIAIAGGVIGGVFGLTALMVWLVPMPVPVCPQGSAYVARLETCLKGAIAPTFR